MKTRFAPSPTGELHLGGLRTALFSHALARKAGGSFALRIEDSDAKRTVVGAEERLVKALKMCGLDHDGPIVKQSLRLPLYQEHAGHLLNTNAAYRCFCTPERLDRVRQMQLAAKQATRYDGVCSHLSPAESQKRAAAKQPFTIRMRAPKSGETIVDDAVVGQVRFANTMLDDQVLIKSDGWPTYHLASVVDDKAMGISHVVRGDEWLSSTPKHLVLYDMFKWTPPKFAHLPLLHTPDGHKLSKRSAMGTPVLVLLAQGYLPSALVNFCAVLGWSPPPEAGLPADNILTHADFISHFSLANVAHSAAVADPARLSFFQAAHMRRALRNPEMSNPEYAMLVEHVTAGLAQNHVASPDPDQMRRTMVLLKERARMPGDFVRNGLHLFLDDVPETDLADLPKAVVDHPKDALRIVQTAATMADTPDALLDLPESLKVDKSLVMTTLRWALTGLSAGAPVPDTARVLGKDRVQRRLGTAAQALVQLVIFSD